MVHRMSQPIFSTPPKKLLDQYHDALHLKQYSQRTEKTNIMQVESHILFTKNVIQTGWAKIRLVHYQVSSRMIRHHLTAESTFDTWPLAHRVQSARGAQL